MNKFKYKSFFMKIFIMLLLSSGILLVVYNTTFIGFFNKTYEKRLIGTNVNMIDKTCDYLDLILSNVIEKANLLSHDEIVINATIIPDINRSKRNNEIISRLRYIVSENPYIKSIYLYIPFNQMVFSSADGIYYLDKFRDRSAVDEYNKGLFYSGQFFMRKYIGENQSREICTYYKDLPKEGVWRTGQIIINLDTEALYTDIKNHIDIGSDELRVVDSAGRVVLGDYSSGNIPSGDEYYKQLEQEIKGHHLGKINEDNYVFFYDTSDITGWKCIYSIKQNKFTMFSQITHTVLMPSIIIFLVVSVISAGFLSRSFYLPIERLVKFILVGHNKDGNIDTKINQNEYDFIGMAYSNIVEKKDRLEELVQNSIPVIRDELFSMLLHDKEIEEKDIQFFSQYLDLKKYLQDKYVVFVLQISKKDDTQNEAVLMERKYNLMRIKNDIESISDESEKITFFSLDFSQIIVICRFDKESSNIDLTMQEFAKNIKTRISKQHRFKVIASIGRIYQGIEHINDSYNEAKDALKYSIYMGKDEIISIDNINKEEKADKISDSYMGHIKKIITVISAGDHDKTSEYLCDYYDYIKRNNPQNTHYINYTFMKLIDAVGQYVITSNLQVNNIFGREKTVYQELEKLENFEDMMSYTSNICHEVVQVVLGINANKHSRYVKKAMEYIEKNFNNSDLSLNNVAEHVGIKSTYLSSLFKSQCGENFVDYINRLRIKKAKELLDQTNITLKEAGYTVGFNTIHNFIRIFKKFEGITPGKYKGLNMEEEN